MSKTVGGAATGYLYDGANPVQELTGTTPSANILTGLGVDEFYRRTDTSGSRDMLTDALGSIIALTDNLAQIKIQYSYKPYGATTATGEANTNPFQYTGRENDGTGVYYYRARYYNPEMGRFISSDPIGFAGGLNTYAYVGGNPIHKTDPTGLMEFPGDSGYANLLPSNGQSPVSPVFPGTGLPIVAEPQQDTPTSCFIKCAIITVTTGYPGDKGIEIVAEKGDNATGVPGLGKALSCMVKRVNKVKQIIDVAQCATRCGPR